VLTGLYFHEYALAPEITPRHYLDVVADEAQDAGAAAGSSWLRANLVREAGAA